MKSTFSICCMLLLPLLVGSVYADDFPYQTRSFFGKYCVSCHGPKKQKADLRVDTLDFDLVDGIDTDHWQEVLDLINLSEMPPHDAKRQPTAAERKEIVKALTSEMRKAMQAKRSSGGRNVLRRLTAYEYNNTLRDLLGLDLNHAADLPPEAAAQEGFKNNSMVLGTSALHLEYFERIARSALERIILAPRERPAPYFVRVEPEMAFAKDEPQQDTKGKKRKTKKPRGTSYNIKGDEFFRPNANIRNPLFKLEHGELDGDSVLLAGERSSDRVRDPFAPVAKRGGSKGDGRSGYQPEFRVELYEVPHDAPVLVRIRAAAVPGKSGTLPRLSFELGAFRGAGVSDQKEAANIEIRSTDMKVYEFVVHGANFPFQSNKPGRPSYFRIFNDFRRGTSKLAYEELPKLKIDWVEIVSNHYEAWPTPQRQAIFFASPSRPNSPSSPNPPNRANEIEYAREVLERFMTRAFRRPVSPGEVDGKVALFTRLSEHEDTFEAAMISTLTAVLCSPNFLMHAEPALEKRQLNAYELASRLSYFLWSSMPDERLFELAESGELLKEETLLAETQRMLDDPKSEEFSRNFAAQWLDLAGVRRLAVNPEYFKFQESTKDLFEEETIRFVHHVLTKDLSIANFIDSKFAVLNPDLAKHYRIPDISGGFGVHMIDSSHHRGGLMTQASMLFGNSTGAETHPIKRGVWVLERMLDDPPPPPPPNVPDLPEPETQDESLLSLKERLVQHAQVESCRDCHQKIDPWGVAFENYNALGQWREGKMDPLVLKPHQEVEIDPATELRNGRQIRDLEDLKQYILIERGPQFRRAVARKVLGYSLGRYIEFSDRAAVDKICEVVERDNDSFRTLIKQVVLSEPFLTK